MGKDLRSICMPAPILTDNSEGPWRRWFQSSGVFALAGRLRLTSDFLWGTPKPQASEDHRLAGYHQPLGHRLPLLLRGSSSASLLCSSNKDEGWFWACALCCEQEALRTWPLHWRMGKIQKQNMCYKILSPTFSLCGSLVVKIMPRWRFFSKYIPTCQVGAVLIECGKKGERKMKSDVFWKVWNQVSILYLRDAK